MKVSKMVVIPAIVALVSSTSLAFAQGTSSSDGEVIEEVVVTGSHVRQKTGYEGSSPVSIIGADDIAAAGAQDLVDVASLLTVNSGTIVSQETGNLVGTSQFNIRGLGVGSTLTLINGRRGGLSTVADSSGVLFFDSKQLPLAMISRIDVQTDGASATYGSDAIGGVVNIITRKGFEGLELSARFQDASNESYAFNIASGLRTDNGVFNLYATAYSQTRNHRTDLDWLVERIHGDGDLTQSRLLSSLGSPGTYRRAIVTGTPTIDPSTATITETGDRFADPDCEAAFGVLTDGRCRYNFADQAAVIPEENRFQVFGEMEMDLTDNFTMFAELSFSNNEIQRSQGPQSYRNGLVDGGDIFIPADHPFNFWIDDPADPGNNLIYIDPSAWDNAIHTAVALVCECRPQGFEANGRGDGAPWNRDIDLAYHRGVLGFDWALGDRWNLSVNYLYALSTRNFRALNNWNSITLNGALLDGMFNPFGTSRVAPDLVSPKDGVSTAGNSMDTLLFIMNEQKTYRRSLQQVVGFIASGDLFDMRNGTVGTAFGVQYRDEAFTLRPDDLTAKGLGNSPTRSAAQFGQTDVFSVFGEVVIPATADLEVQLAVRYEDYGDAVGTTTNPKLAARWDLSDTVSLRGSFGSAFRGPSIPQTGLATSSTFIDDPFTGDSSTVAVRTQGSDSLVPESSDNWNLGVIFQPLDDLSIKLGYWHFDYTDLITADEGPQAIVNNDFNDDGIPNDPRILRSGAGQLRVITSEFINTGSVQTDGIDITLDYARSLNALGDMNFGLAISRVNTFDVVNANGTTFDGVGSRNFTNQFSSLPEYRANATVGWGNGPHSAALVIRHIDSYENDQSPGTEIDSWTSIDVRYNLDLDIFGNDQVTSLTIGARNLFDEDPPSLGDRQRPAYDDRVHDVRGRAAYVELRYLF